MSYRALAAEFIGTFALMSAICGAGLFSSTNNLGQISIALAAGLMLMAAYTALSHISGGHFNPAVTLGFVASGLVEPLEAIRYISAQVLGAICAAIIFWLILTGANSSDLNSFADIANRYDENGRFSLTATILLETTLTTLFVLIVVGSTSPRVPIGLAPIAIGFTYAALGMAVLPLSNASLNPARSTALALVAGPKTLTNLWVFWVAPISGAIIAGLIGRWLYDD